VESGVAKLLDTLLEGGPGGIPWGVCSSGATGPSSVIAAGATLNTLPGHSSVYTVEAVVREGDPMTLSIKGSPGEFVWLVVGFGDLPMMLPMPGFQGVFMAGLPWLPIPLGTVPAGGTLNLPSSTPELPAGLDFVGLTTQVILGTSGSWVLGSPRMTWVLDSAF
jgi:hypothetical protein